MAKTERSIKNIGDSQFEQRVPDQKFKLNRGKQ